MLTLPGYSRGLDLWKRGDEIYCCISVGGIATAVKGVFLKASGLSTTSAQVLVIVPADTLGEQEHKIAIPLLDVGGASLVALSLPSTAVAKPVWRGVQLRSSYAVGSL